MTPRRALEQALTNACERALGISGVDPLLTPSAHADYQANFAMSLAKRLGEPPRAIAERVIAELDVEAEIAGPGFVNLTVSADALAAWATEALNASAASRNFMLATLTDAVASTAFSFVRVSAQLVTGFGAGVVAADSVAGSRSDISSLNVASSTGRSLTPSQVAPGATLF